MRTAAPKTRAVDDGRIDAHKGTLPGSNCCDGEVALSLGDADGDAPNDGKIGGASSQSGISKPGGLLARNDGHRGGSGTGKGDLIIVGRGGSGSNPSETKG